MIKTTEENKPQYRLFDYWKDKNIDANEGKLSRDSLFLYFSMGAPRPCSAGFGKFSYCSNPQFAAGYLKYLVLGNLACSLLLSNEEYQRMCGMETDGSRAFILPNIDDIVRMYEKDKEKNVEILKIIKHIISFCNMVFEERDLGKQKDYIKLASITFNNYCDDEIAEISDWDFEFGVYNGADDARAAFLDSITNYELSNNITDVFAKKKWSLRDICAVKRAIDYIL